MGFSGGLMIIKKTSPYELLLAEQYLQQSAWVIIKYGTRMDG
jgi:hypothetical protein